MIYLRMSKEDDARLTKAAKRLGKSKTGFARDAIEVQLPVLEQQDAEKAQDIETGYINRQ